MKLDDYLKLDEFWQEAIFQSVSQYIEEQNKQQKRSFEEMSRKIEEIKPYSSPITNKPTFHMS